MDFPRIWNTLLNAGDKLLARERVSARPLRIHIEVNDLCNLKCPHCPRENPDIPKNTGHVPFEAIKRLEPWMRTASYVGLTGNGEPFLHPNIMEILRLVIECGATPSVISNATLWKRLGVVEQLAGMGPMLLNVSIDGGTRETFEKWRLKANYDEVRANLRELREARDRAGSPFPITTFNVCLMKDNLEEVEEIVDWGAEAGVSVINFQNLYPYVDGLEDQRIRDIDACRKAIANARKRAAPHGIRIDWLPMSFDIDERDANEGGSYGAYTAAEADGRVGHKPATANGKHSYHCDNVWNQIHVTVKGEIKFCCFWTEGAVGDLLKDDVGTLWNGEEWVKLRADLKAGRKPAPCVGCHNLVERDRGKLLKTSIGELRDLVKR
ncbi:MAG: hypothetical protein PWP23_3212 [Candidatus Sumerlaeota bacterium]|nr:hypothetical protein [Candidatus Sumerlaeota bacterium]